MWAREHLLSPPVVQRDQLVAALPPQALEESPQRRGLRIVWQPGQVLKHAVVAQRLGRLDPTQAKNQRVEQRLDHFANRVIGVPLREANMPIDLPAKAQTLKKGVKQRHAAKGGQADPVARNPQISGTSAH